jgi:hypothetical protein
MADDEEERSLYAGPRATFIERRKELAGAARQDGDRDRAKVIAGLRKPTAAAHCINLLAQSSDASLERLLELGGEIRRAFADGDDDHMRQLLQQRPAAVTEAATRARALSEESGEPAGAAVGDQVVQTLRAAMASDDAADEVRSGMLTDALDEPGFAVLGVGSGPQRSAPKAKRQNKATRSDDTAALLKAESAAQRAVEEAERAAEEAEHHAAQVGQRRAELEHRRDEIVSQLAGIDEELAEIKATEVDAQRQQRRAVTSLDEARRRRTR